MLAKIELHLRALVWLLALLLFTCAYSHANTGNADPSRAEDGLIGTSVYYFVDDAGDMTPSLALETYRAGGFSKHPGNFHLGYTDRPVWVALRGNRSPDTPENRVLLIEPVTLDRIDLFIASQSEVQPTAVGRAGDLLPASARPLQERRPGFFVQLPPGESTLLLRVQTTSQMTVVPRLLTDAEYRSNAIGDTLFIGLFYGLLIAALVYNLITWLSLRHPNDLYYSVYLLIQIVYYLSFNGLLGLYVFPDEPVAANKFLVLILSASVGFGAFLFSKLLELDSRAVWTNLLLFIVYLSSLTAPLVTYLGSHHLALPILLFAIFLSYCVFGYKAVIALTKPKKDLKIFGFSYLLYGGAIVATVLTNFAILPATVLIIYLPQVVQFVHAVAIQIGLFVQVRGIEESTHALEHEKEILMDIAVHDPLTGLFNRVHLNRELARESARFKRYGNQYSVAMIDIDKFKTINDEYGHPTGDEILRGVAAALKNSVRSVDVLGRWGGEEFLVLSPETSQDGAMTLAEKLRNAIATSPFPIKQPVTVSIGVWSPQAEDSPEQAITKADQALYDAKHRGRNRVVVFGN